jgi:hypothetical protein
VIALKRPAAAPGSARHPFPSMVAATTAGAPSEGAVVRSAQPTPSANRNNAPPRRSIATGHAKRRAGGCDPYSDVAEEGMGLTERGTGNVAGDRSPAKGLFCDSGVLLLRDESW